MQSFQLCVNRRYLQCVRFRSVVAITLDFETNFQQPEFESRRDLIFFFPNFPFCHGSIRYTTYSLFIKKKFYFGEQRIFLCIIR